jgi:hypothetical protein
MDVVDHLSLIARPADGELSRIQAIIDGAIQVDGRVEVEEALSRLAVVGNRQPRTLDLIGHSTSDGLVLLGDWMIDARRGSVRAFFRGLVDDELLPRLGITAVRLLGCETATSDVGRATICTLADILGVEVYGTSQMIYAADYDVRGFRDDHEHILVGSCAVREGVPRTAMRRGAPPYPRMLDIETLPASPLTDYQQVPRRVADMATAERLLQLVRRSGGAQMPGLLAAPLCEIALPASLKPRWYHRIQILLDGDFVRVYPDGDAFPGVVFAVDDPRALRALVADIPVG